MPKLLAPFVLLTSLIAVALPSTSEAATGTRVIAQVAAGLCGANNPANDAQLRRLPNGLRNTGAANVSVVCNQWGDDGTAPPASLVSAYAWNDRAVAVTFTCTLTMGAPFYSQTVATKSVSIPAGNFNVIQWTTDDYGTGTNMQWVNLQCSLPQAVTLREVVFVYAEDITN